MRGTTLLATILYRNLFKFINFNVIIGSIALRFSSFRTTQTLAEKTNKTTYPNLPKVYLKIERLSIRYRDLRAFRRACRCAIRRFCCWSRLIAR